MLEIVQHQ